MVCSFGSRAMNGGAVAFPVMSQRVRLSGLAHDVMLQRTEHC
jgi:hypothetical protein